MRILIVGAGRMGSVAAEYLRVQLMQDCEVLICDSSPERLDKVCNRLKIPYENRICKDINNLLVNDISDCDVLLSAVPYNYNLYLTKLAINAGKHMADLGGNNDIVQEQLKLNEQAKEKNISIIPDCGLAPGLANMLAASSINEALTYVDFIDDVKIRVGGLPKDPPAPFYYGCNWSIDGLINEYIEPCMVLRDNKIKTESALSRLEIVDSKKIYDVFKKYFLRADFEAFNTSGGISTLCQTYLGKVRNMNYKTIRHAGHYNIMNALSIMDFFNKDNINQTKDLFNKKMKMDKLLDFVIVNVSLEAGRCSIDYWLLDESHHDNTAMARTTGYSLGIVGYLLANNRCNSGVLPGEKSLPLDEYIKLIGREFSLIKELKYRS